jgi:NADP-dependent 3-hydroxy acid dehydrogenase YdfG
MSTEKPIAVVTGVSSGIGREMVHALISKGYFVCGCARRQEKIDELSKQYDNKTGYFSAVDVSNGEQLQKFTNYITTEIGIPKLVIANAAVLRPGTVVNASEDDFNTSFNINIKGVFLLAKYLLPHMKSESNKDNKCGFFGISSAAGRNGIGKMSIYCASKWALEGFISSLAQELNESNVMCASYDPGVVATGMTHGMPNTDKWITSEEEGKAAIEQFLKTIDNGTDLNGKQLTTTLIEDKRTQEAFQNIMEAMARM